MASFDPGAEASAHYDDLPDIQVSVRQLFGVDTDLQVPAFSAPTDHGAGIE